MQLFRWLAFILVLVLAYTPLLHAQVDEGAQERILLLKARETQFLELSGKIQLGGTLDIHHRSQNGYRRGRVRDWGLTTGAHFILGFRVLDWLTPQLGLGLSLQHLNLTSNTADWRAGGLQDTSVPDRWNQIYGVLEIPIGLRAEIPTKGYVRPYFSLHYVNQVYLWRSDFRIFNDDSRRINNRSLLSGTTQPYNGYQGAIRASFGLLVPLPPKPMGIQVGLFYQANELIATRRTDAVSEAFTLRHQIGLDVAFYWRKSLK
jgi:hypothetical protein